jgi:hypothetical protein
MAASYHQEIHMKLRLSRILAVAGLLISTGMVVSGITGACWFFFMAVLAALVCDVMEDFLKGRLEAALKEGNERNELIAKQLAELNGQIQRDISELKGGMFQLKSRSGFGD